MKTNINAVRRPRVSVVPAEGGRKWASKTYEIIRPLICSGHLDVRIGFFFLLEDVSTKSKLILGYVNGNDNGDDNSNNNNSNQRRV